MQVKFSRIHHAIVLCIIIMGIILLGMAQITSGIAHPSENDCSCHVSYPFSINSTTPSKINVNPNENFSIFIKANGPEGILVFHPDPYNNSKFQIFPNENITDNSIFDLNITENEIVVNYTLTAPSQAGDYIILFFVRQPDVEKPRIACITFDIQVGNPPIDYHQILNQFFEKLFNHLNIYLGTAAMLCLIIGTLLYEKDRMNVKAHGILATISLILTSINVLIILPETIQVFQYWDSTLWENWFHLLHIILGSVGYIAAIYALILGFSGIRDKKPGYIALVSWGINFISGLIIWGVNI